MLLGTIKNETMLKTYLMYYKDYHMMSCTNVYDRLTPKQLKLCAVFAPIILFDITSHTRLLDLPEINLLLDNYKEYQEVKEMASILSSLQNCMKHSETVTDLVRQADNIDHLKELMLEHIEILNTYEAINPITGEKQIFRKWDVSTAGTYTKTIEYYGSYKGHTSPFKSIQEVYTVTCVDLAQTIITLEWYINNNIPYESNVLDSVVVPLSACEEYTPTETFSYQHSYIASMTNPDHITPGKGYHHKF